MLKDHLKSTSSPFRKTIAVASSLGPIADTALALDWIYSTKHEFPFMHWVTNSMRKQLVINVTTMSLLY